MQAVPGFDGLGMHEPRRHAAQGCLELGSGLAGGDLAKIAALLGRGAGRVGGGRGGEPRRGLRQLGDQGRCRRTGPVAGFHVVRSGDEQDVGGLEHVGRPEATDIGVVVAATCRLVGARHRDLALDQGAQPRFLRRLAASLAVVERLGLDRQSLGFLQQQFADRQSSCRQHPGVVGIGSLMMLGLARDRRARDDHAVDTDRLGPDETTAGRARRDSGLRRAHGFTPPADGSQATAGGGARPDSRGGRDTRPAPTRCARGG
jgi:hypothetical protein